MAIFTPTTMTLVTGETILKSEVAMVGPLQGRLIDGGVDYRSYELVLKSGTSVEVFERNHPRENMLFKLGFE